MGCLPPGAAAATSDASIHSKPFLNICGRNHWNTHTQNIKSHWNRVKSKFKRMKGVHEDMLSSYLDDFLWRERHGTCYAEALQNIAEALQNML